MTNREINKLLKQLDKQHRQSIVRDYKAATASVIVITLIALIFTF